MSERRPAQPFAPDYGEASNQALRFPLIGGLLLATLGFGQFLFFLGLDSIGVIEVGNALGHGLLLWICAAAGAMLILAGVLLDLLRALLRIRRR
jgi:hypothetical protein